MKKFNFLLTVSLLLTETAFSQNEWNSVNNSTSAMFRNGFVGIGTGATTPTLPFVVNNPTVGTGTKISFGNNSIQGTYGTSEAVLDVTSPSTAGGAWFNLNSGAGNSRSSIILQMSSTFGAAIYSTKGSSGTAFPLTFYTHGSGGLSEKMRIQLDGNVGVGTTNPIGKFQVDNTAYKIAMGSFNSGAPDYMGNYVGWNAARSGTNFTFDTDGANNGGAVIATGVSGDMRIITFPTGAPGTSLQTKTDAQVIANTRMIIKNDGKVGIGAPASYPGTYKLYVTGGILTEKVKVAVNGSAAWSDFVFAEDYKLTPLNEVEQFINKYKHLQDIPSAIEVTANGIDLAEINAKLLQKIEELTLYVIAQEKRIQKLEKE